MKKVKISELPSCESIDGLYTIGTDENNRSVKVSLDFVKDRINKVIEEKVQAVGEPWGGGAVVGDIKWTDVIVPSGDGINYKTLDVAIGELAEGILMKGDTERTRMRDDIQGTMELLFYHGRSITNFVNFIGPAIFDLLNPIAAKLGGSALMGYADVDMNAGGFVHVQQIKFPKVDIPGAGITSLPAMCLLTESEYAGLAEKDPGVLYVVKG